MKLPGYHTAILLRAILLMLVIATQMFLPLSGGTLACASECAESHGVQASLAADTSHDSCGDHAEDESPLAETHREDLPGDQQSGDCFLHGCPCCAFLMFPGGSDWPEAAQFQASIFSPALLGNPITRGPLPLDHPPC